jgi:hypothetical protein
MRIRPAEATEDSQVTLRAPRRRGTDLVLLLAGAVCLVAGLLPAALVPVQHDDMVLLFADNAISSSAMDILDAKFTGTTDAGRTNFLSSTIDGLDNYLIWHASEALSVHPAVVERGVFFLWVFAAVGAAAYFARTATAAGRGVAREGPGAFSTAFFVVAAFVGGTAQIHSRWSNDPVVSYPTFGFGAAAVAFLYLAAVFRLVGRRDWGVGSAAFAGLAGIIAAFWYELEWPLFGVITFVLAIYAWRRRDLTRRTGAVWAASVLGPLLVLLAVRAFVGAQAGASPSTQVHVGLDSVVAFGRGVLGSLPGAAWPLSAHAIVDADEALPDLRFLLALTTFALALAGALAAVARSSDGAPLLGGPPSRVLEWRLAMAVVGLYLIAAIGLTVSTVKYSQELYRIGTVYTFYGPALVGTGLLFYGLLLRLQRASSMRRSTVAFGVLVVSGFLAVQGTLNWGLLDTQRRDMATAHRLVGLSNDPGAPRVERCRAAEEFASSEFPYYGYPSALMIEDLNTTRLRDHGEAFCSPAPVPQP